MQAGVSTESLQHKFLTMNSTRRGSHLGHSDHVSSQVFYSLCASSHLDSCLTIGGVGIFLDILSVTNAISPFHTHT